MVLKDGLAIQERTKARGPDIVNLRSADSIEKYSVRILVAGRDRSIHRAVGIARAR